MAGRLDDVVGAADEPVIAVGIALGEVAGEIPVAGEALGVALLLVEVAAHHRGPALLQRQFALHHGLVDRLHRARVGAAHHRRLDARQRQAHRARLDVERGEVGDHDAARLGLPPIVVKRHAEGVLAPQHRLGIERLADARHEAQGRKIVALHRLAAELHHHADGGGGRIPDAHALAFQNRVPGLGVELGLDHHVGHAVGQRRDDAVAGAGDPAGIGRAPEHVVLMQIEGIDAGDVVRDHRAMHMDCALGPPGRAAGEMQQRHLFRIGRFDREVGRGGVHQRVPAVHAFAPSASAPTTMTWRSPGRRGRRPRSCGGKARAS
jgi:hypothetical protein